MERERERERRQRCTALVALRRAVRREIEDRFIKGTDIHIQPLNVRACRGLSRSWAEKRKANMFVFILM
jgi:hypothetical protein